MQSGPGESVLSKEPLRFRDEFVRTQVLDIIGDLASLVCRVRGHIVAVKPGHSTNAELVARLRVSKRAAGSGH